MIFILVPGLNDGQDALDREMKHHLTGFVAFRAQKSAKVIVFFQHQMQSPVGQQIIHLIYMEDIQQRFLKLPVGGESFQFAVRGTERTKILQRMVDQSNQRVVLAVKILVKGHSGDPRVLAQRPDGNVAIAFLFHGSEQAVFQLPLTADGIFGDAVAIHEGPPFL